MSDREKDILLYEIRQNRKEIKKVNDRLNALDNFKFYLMGIATVFGTFGHKVAKFFGF